MFNNRYFISKSCFYTGLQEFFTIIGCYSSMIILLEDPPDPCPSMDPDMLRLYLLYKRGEKGTPLRNASGSPITDVQGMPVLCLGGWNAFVCVEQLFTLVRGIHEYYGNGGSFQNICTACQQGVLQNPEFPGCRWHFHCRKFIRRVHFLSLTFCNYIILSVL